MKKILFLIFFSFLILLGNLSAEHKIRISSRKGEQILLPGDIANIRVMVWPLPEGDETKVLEIEGLEFIFGLKVFEITWSERNKNNSDVFEFEAKVAYRGRPKVNVSSFEIGANSYVASLDKLVLESGDDKVEDYVLLDQGYPFEIYWWVYCLVLLLCITFAFLARWLLKKRKEKIVRIAELHLRKEQILKFHDEFKKAESREDFEKIKETYKEWSRLIRNPAGEIEIYIFNVKKIQYQREWSEEDFKNVRDSFEKIKNIFNSEVVGGV